MATAPHLAFTPRKTPRQARSAVTVDAIFEGAIQVLLSLGSTRLTTTRVAQRAGVSVGTLYQYFPNKEALLLALLERHLAMLASSLESACREHHGATAAAMAGAVMKGYIQAKARQSEISRALYLIALEFDAREMVEVATRRGERAIAAMLSSANDGCVAQPDLVAQILLAAVQGTVRALYERGLPPVIGGEIEAQLSALCGSYLAAMFATCMPVAAGQ